MSDPFRSQEAEIKKVADELRDLKIVLREVSRKVSQIERRAKSAFPKNFGEVKQGTSIETLDTQAALDFYDELVSLTKQGKSDAAKAQLESATTANLLIVARELGVPLGGKRATKRTLIEGIKNRISQSVQLNRHVSRASESRENYS